MADHSTEATSRRHWLTGLAVALLCIGLYVGDRKLAQVEQRELTAEAANYYEQARRLIGEEHVSEAIPLLQRAWSLQRSSRTYQIALSSALVLTGRTQEASQLLTDVLTRDPNNGPANLQMARLLRSSGDVGNAAAYYHRAIYGLWASRREEEILRSRMELAEMLAREHRSRDLLSELLLLEDSAKDNPVLQEKVARWYLEAGSPARAAELLHTVVARSDSATADAYEVLGDAELASGHYRPAQAAYTAALRRGHEAVSNRLLTTVELVQLDPTLRGLSTAERTHRAGLVLSRALRLLDNCAPNPDLKEEAEAALAQQKKKKAAEPEDLLSAAEQIWTYTDQNCPGNQNSDPALRTLMNRLTQQP